MNWLTHQKSNISPIGAYLSGANLIDANLSDAYLSGAEYNSQTIWPDGFDPVKAAAVLVEDK